MGWKTEEWDLYLNYGNHGYNIMQIAFCVKQHESIVYWILIVISGNNCWLLFAYSEICDSVDLCRNSLLSH